MRVFGLLLGSVCAVAAAQIFHGDPGATRKPDQTVPDAAGGAISALAYSTDGNTLTLVDRGNGVRLWDLKTGAQTQGPARAAAAVCSDQKVQVLDSTFDLGGARDCIAALSHDGKALAAVVKGGKVRVWDAATGALTRTVNAGAEVRSVAVSAGWTAAGFGNGTLKVWPADASGSPRAWNAHREAIRAVAIGSDGVQVASAGADKAIKVWDLKTGALLSTLEGHSDAVLALAFSPNGRTIASAGADRTVRYWTTPLPPIPAEDLEKITAAIPSKARAAAKKPRKVLVFWRADAIQHKSGVPAANKAIELMARKTGAFQADFSRDYDVLDPKVLANYDAIIMNSTAHLAIPDEAKKQAFLDYVRGGGGVIGIHAAIDTFKDWPGGAEVIGATFGGHPFVPTGRWAVKIEEPEHPLLRAFAGNGFVIQDEIYEMGEPYTRADRRVLLSLDLSDPETAAITLPRPGKESIHRADKDFAVSWLKRYGSGRVFYADFGHVAGPFQSAAIMQFYLDGIQYVLGDLEADDRAVAKK